MKRQKLTLATVAFLSASILVLASCSNKEKETAAPPQSRSTITTEAGVAGGVKEEVFTAEAIVTAVDVPSRRVTLKGSDGQPYTFTAKSDIENLPQLKVGDKVTATFTRRMVVTVRSDNAPISEERALAASTARPGEKPGVLVAEETEQVARVKAIDTVNRTAELEFVDGRIRRLPVRADVDLSRYKVGDNVVIRVTTSLTVLAAAP